MTLEDLGYNTLLEDYRKNHQLDAFAVGRVITAHKDRYIVRNETNEYDSELIGNLRFTAETRADFPAVGDWVAISEYDEGKALIHAIYPRHSMITRQAAGRSTEVQIIASNIDYGLIVQAVDRDFNLNRLERYLTICHAAKVTPIIVLSKTDLIEAAELETLQLEIANRIGKVKVICVSNQAEGGYDLLGKEMQPGKTYCLLGSSGVGKSTLLNHLSGNEHMETGAISDSVKKGKHTTSHRELVVLDNGSMLIDNPGMREVGIADTSGGLETTFEEITQLALECRFSDCTHLNELGCAVLAALDNGELDRSVFNNYHKMLREKMHFESSVEEKRKKDKNFGKMIKEVKSARKKNKY
ncbi:MAG: ribosome small subunit-dependent GTPase A [Cyclobacteriaceae bacterium]